MPRLIGVVLDAYQVIPEFVRIQLNLFDATVFSSDEEVTTP